MSFVDDEARVSVPATSANLGPGFDTLGLALELRDDLSARVTDAGVGVDVAGEGAGDVARDETHLVLRSMRSAFDVLGGQPPGLLLTCRNRIPHARGLGSSAAAIVGGVFLARRLVDDGDAVLSVDDAFRLAAEIEGHPDNVAPAVYGGLTVAGRSGERFYAARATVAPSVRAVAFVPPTALSTAARTLGSWGSTPNSCRRTSVGAVAVHGWPLGFSPPSALRAGKSAPPSHWPSSPCRARSRAPQPSVATRARSAATVAGDASARSRRTCQRMAGSESRSQSRTFMAGSLTYSAPCGGPSQVPEWAAFGHARSLGKRGGAMKIAGLMPP